MKVTDTEWHVPRHRSRDLQPRHGARSAGYRGVAGRLAEPGLPYGKYTVCVSGNVGHEQREKRSPEPSDLKDRRDRRRRSSNITVRRHERDLLMRRRLQAHAQRRAGHDPDRAARRDHRRDDHLRRADRDGARLDAQHDPGHQPRPRDRRTRAGVVHRITNELHSSCVAQYVSRSRRKAPAPKLAFAHAYGSEVTPVPVKTAISLSGTTLTQTDYPVASGSTPVLDLQHDAVLDPDDPHQRQPLLGQRADLHLLQSRKRRARRNPADRARPNSD